MENTTETETTTTAMTVFNKTQYAIFAPNATNDLREAIQMNIESGVKKRDLFTKISMPLGGNTIFNYQTAEGEVAATTLTGIVLYVGSDRAYYPNPYGVDKFPHCFSTDGKTGVGDPGGNCMSCINNQFGNNNTPKPCGEKKPIYVLMKDDILPIVINATSMSFDAWKQYGLFLMRKGLTYNKVETVFSLVQKVRKTDGKTKVSTLSFTMGNKIDAETVQMIAHLKNDIVPFLDYQEPVDEQLKAA